MEEFKKAYARLNPAQRQAVDQIDGPLLVVAGPGTGKTQLLVTRVANILHKTDTLPQNILCLTFTDAAAHTMRERLTNLIGKSAYDITISTYHAFGNELIRRYNHYFIETIDEQAIDALGVDTILREIINELPYNNLLKAEFYLRDIKSLLSDCKRAVLSPDDIRDIANQNQTFYINANQVVQNIFAQFTLISKKTAPLFEQLLKNTPPITSKLPSSVKELVEIWQHELLQAITVWKATGKTSSLTLWKNKWLAKDKKGAFIVAAEQGTEKLLAFSDVYEQYQQTLKQRKLFDYDDMIMRAVDGLERHVDLRYTLQEQYQYVLLDEFQDTNGAQLRLIELLTDHPVNERRPNILAVGDDDQAIYAFQGADYSHLLAFIQLYKDVEIIALVKNYRSSDEILRVADSIANQIGERIGKHIEKVTKKLEADVPKNEPSIVQRHEFKSDVAQYAWIARQASKLVTQGVETNEIAVIAPQHKYLEPLVPYLHHAGLAVRYEKRENILDDPVILSLITMCQLVTALRDSDFTKADSLWPEVLSADYWNLPTSFLWNLSWVIYDKKHHWTPLLLVHDETRLICLFFNRLAVISGRETLESTLDLLIGVEDIDLHEDKTSFRSPFYDFYFGNTTKPETNTAFWQLLSNLTVLRQHLRDYRVDNTSPLGLNDFIEFATAHQNAQINLMNTSPYYESFRAIQLMTAYKAKGQEFKAVFVVGCVDEIWGNSAHHQASTLSIPPNLQFIRYSGTSEDEQLRLFYVAITRAKSYLYLTSYTNTYSNKLMTRLKFLNETVDENSVVISPLLPEKERVVHADDTIAPKLATLSLYWQQRHYSALTEVDIHALLSSRLDYFQLSATHVNQFVDILSEGPRSFFINTLLHFPRSRKPSAAFGNAIHETLEWIQLYYKEKTKAPTEQSILKTFQQRLLTKRLSLHDTTLLLERGNATLHTYYGLKKDTFRTEDVSEHNFRKEGVFVKDAHLTGTIDKLVIDRPTKSITIVDYKTGRSHQKWNQSDIVLHKYRHQLYFYKLLVERSRTFKNYTVKNAYLEFVEPDNRGNINSLQLSFEDNEQRRLEQLIHGVWQKIMKLDFPDTNSYPQTFKGVSTFEDDISIK